MLSKNIRPFTKVIGLPYISPEHYLKPEYLDQVAAYVDDNHEGKIFTVNQIVQARPAIIGFAVEFMEIDGLWALECYRPLELPKCLTSLLTARPRELERV